MGGAGGGATWAPANAAQANRAKAKQRRGLSPSIPPEIAGKVPGNASSPGGRLRSVSTRLLDVVDLDQSHAGAAADPADDGGIRPRSQRLNQGRFFVVAGCELRGLDLRLLRTFPIIGGADDAAVCVYQVHARVSEKTGHAAISARWTQSANEHLYVLRPSGRHD